MANAKSVGGISSAAVIHVCKESIKSAEYSSQGDTSNNMDTFATATLANSSFSPYSQPVASKIANSFPEVRRSNDVASSSLFSPIDIFTEATASTKSASSLYDEALLDKVRLARNVVQSVREIVEIQPCSTKQAGQPVAVDAVLAHKRREEDLNSLGEDLYELFSGIKLSDFDAITDSFAAEEKKIPQHSQKKEKRGKVSAANACIPLSDFGLPSTLCSLVHNLLEYRIDNGQQWHVYESSRDVEEDLCLMAEKPELFLSRQPARGGELCLKEMPLYSREEDASKLMVAFDRAASLESASSITDVVFVTGYSGTGKSALVESVQRRFEERGACFVTGKFDLMQRLQPLSAMVSAMDSYCNKLAQDRAEDAGASITTAIGSEAGVLATLIPNLSKLVSEESETYQSAVLPAGCDALQRLIFLFRMLFRATCSPAHPVVLMLDDLQWADQVSLDLMQALITDSGITGLLFIGCYRDNEIGEDHPLKSSLHAIRRSSCVSTTTIALENLSLDSVNALVSDILCLTPRMTKSLAEVVFRKTGGNALFVVQLLTSLHDEGFLRYSLTLRRWDWDMTKISGKSIAGNVVELMRGKLMRLAPEVREVVKVAAAFGAQCQEALVTILDRAPDCIMSTGAALDIAILEGLIMKSSESVYSFSHDQIQDAAYRLIPKAERAVFHLRIGRLLRNFSLDAEMEAFLFVVVDHLTRGSHLITDCDERFDLVQLCLLAGQMSSSMSAFPPACAYLKAGIDLLVEDDWEQHRDVCLDLYIYCAETEYALGEFDYMAKCSEEVLRRARTLKESARGYYIQVQLMGAQGPSGTEAAVDRSIATLALLGELFPIDTNPALIGQEIQATLGLFNAETDKSILQLRNMDFCEKQEAMRLLNFLIYYVIAGRKKEYFPFVASRMVRLSLLHGYTRDSAYGFASFGIVLCGLMGNRAGGYRCGKIALALLDRFQATEQMAKVYVSVYGTVNNWVEPIQSCLDCLKQAHNVGLATGDTKHAMAAAQVFVGAALCSGQELGLLIDESESYSNQMLEYKQHTIYMAFVLVKRAMLILRHGFPGSPKRIRILMEEAMDNKNAEENCESAPTYPYYDMLTNFYCMWLEYLFGEYELCWQTAQKNKDISRQSIGRFPFLCTHFFYSGLAALELAQKHFKTEYITAINEAITQMKAWATSTQWNCQHKLDLLNAELAHLKGDEAGAAELYDVAIQAAGKHQFIHEEALAFERAGNFYQGSGDRKKASFCFRKAHDGYTKWGATGKAAQVQEKWGLV
uniref:Orc1-like AAA ATPase domain-containing protein n=2 Tax=Odontella aurita TaxID=265563 RepID=A0A7S4N4H0_9STRA